MNTKNIMEKFILYAYFLLEAVIFFLIKWAQHTQPYEITGKVMYSAIVLNFVVMLYFYIKKRGEIYVPLALSMTLVADYFLTLTDSYFNVGVFCFIIVQLIYSRKIGWTGNHIRIMVKFSLIYLILIRYLGMSFDFSILCGCSFGILTGNVLFSMRTASHTHEKMDWIFAIGLLLFAGCDLSLGLRMICEGVESMQLFHDIMNDLIWTCYVPAQVLLTLSYVFL